jgi:hypothetical protein
MSGRPPEGIPYMGLRGWEQQGLGGAEMRLGDPCERF